MKNFLRTLMLVMTVISTFSCKKDFLDAKPNKSLLVPETLADFQAILDNNQVMNQVPYLTAVSNDDIYSTDAGLATMNVHIRNSYLWANNMYEGLSVADWNVPYQQVFYANVVLDGLDSKNFRDEQANQIKGAALFFRAWANYHLVTEFCKAYDPSTATTDLGIPLKKTADVSLKSKRSSLREAYDFMKSDLNDAVKLLPVNSTYKSRPNKAAAFALLARIALNMDEFEGALINANECLKINDKLIDYNTLNTTITRPFPLVLPNGNEEVLFNAEVFGTPTLTNYRSTIIAPLLYTSYHINDLRRTAFFNNRGNGVVNFKGNYSGSFIVFGGLATDEVYLIRAEAYARTGNKEKAMDDLNLLMRKRWKNNTPYPVFIAQNDDQALANVLSERRKELVYRNTRWNDLKRLNRDAKFAVTITRTVKGENLTLQPNDKRYVFPIPDEEIRLSGIQQNER